MNASFPHHLLNLCQELGCRLIHYSTDCVFDGKKGQPYTEIDPFTAKDIYGVTKYLGELNEAPAITLRTSIIGHELGSKVSLIEWFLAQEGSINGYSHAIYSGLPAVEHARVIAEYILPHPQMVGLFHLASEPISKCNLLHLVANTYNKSIRIIPDNTVHEDKRLSYEKFHAVSGYVAPDWKKLIQIMYNSHQSYMEDLS
jgi:dTDP-4-dehydrorhamnose reductase